MKFRYSLSFDNKNTNSENIRWESSNAIELDKNGTIIGLENAASYCAEICTALQGGVDYLMDEPAAISLIIDRPFFCWMRVSKFTDNR